MIDSGNTRARRSLVVQEGGPLRWWTTGNEHAVTHAVWGSMVAYCGAKTAGGRFVARPLPGLACRRCAKHDRIRAALYGAAAE